ncbi:MAG: sulfide/dihydroorotate dehydrogenase-like FAD/NAD-binding protein [Candidatus Omnitrophota bacterium]|jgi:ferredoxin--NADP+ reductase
MHKIVRKEQLNREICLVEFEAEDIAKVARPGQFVILQVDETGERFPLTIYDFDRGKGRMTVVCQAIGVSTKKLCALNKGGSILNVVGPLGHATNTRDIGKVLIIGGGVGTAEAYPIAKAMREDGNDVSVIIGARTKDLVICEDEIRKFCDDVYVTTDDGSYGRKGFVTEVLKELIEKDSYDLVYAIGPIPMMKYAAEITKPESIKTMVSLNSIMVDATGMCGCCRVHYGGESKFTCVDGPEFDAHLVDFEELMNRQDRYKGKERQALEHYENECKIGLHRRGKTKK